MSEKPDEERISFAFRPGFADVDLLRAEHTPRTWTVFNARYAFAMLHTWKGRVDYRRRRVDAGPAQVFCCEAGEVHTASPSSDHLGSFKVLFIGPEAFEAQCRAEGLRGAPHFAKIMAKATPRLGGALRALHAGLEGDATSLELQSSLALVTQALIAEVAERCVVPAARLPAQGNLQRLRDLLHSHEGSRVSLLEFAQSCDLSPYQLLRGFKRKYGLPPHAYELNLRVDRARQLLRQGYTVAAAAAANDFTDQSHFTRHFRRIWGITPGQYAR
jgi:AraC-like DNA-binding protein